MNECLLTPQHESEKKTTIVKHFFNDTLDTFVLTIIFMSEIILQTKYTRAIVTRPRLVYCSYRSLHNIYFHYQVYIYTHTF